MLRANLGRTASLFALAAFVLAGCGEYEPKMTRRAVEIAKLPAPLLQSARKELPGVDFTEAWSNHLTGQDAINSYEIRGRNTASGKIREVRIGLDGKILEKE